MAQRLAILILVILAVGMLPAPATAAPLAQASPCATAVAAAVAQRGANYIWGAKGPVAFDCSGLTYYAWGQAGYNIGVSTYNQVQRGRATACNLSHLAGGASTCWEPGDLIFLRYSGGQHVAMYIGNGLFADAYNTATGVIIHAVENDSFYQANFWQARRITECGGAGGATTAPDSVVLSNPDLEQIPDVLMPVAFIVPQCGNCNADGSIILPATEWGETWPSGFEWLNPVVGFRTIISWLAWQVSEMFRTLICWLLTMLQLLAGFFATGINVVIAGINALFKMLLLLWLALRGYFVSMWSLLESMRDLLYGLQFGFEQFAGWLAMIGDAAWLLIQFIGRLIYLLGQLAMAVMGALAWLGGLFIGMWLSIQLAIVGTTVPVQLGDTHIIYRATRGMLEGVRDSAIGWVFVLLWGMAYVAFVAWLARFMSVGRGVES